MSAEPLIVSVPCDVCGDICAGFELLPSNAARSQGPDHPRLDLGAYRMYVWNFERSGESEISLDTYERLSRLLQDRDYTGLSNNFDWRYCVFWCEPCKRCYCIKHWTIEYVHDDPMCSEFGKCPEGHGKILDD